MDPDGETWEAYYQAGYERIKGKRSYTSVQRSEGASMYTARLRKVGGSVMLVVPPTLLDVLRLSAGNAVELSVDDGRLIVEPRRVPRYTLQELLAQCDSTAEISAEDRQWLDAQRVGRELL